jgi:hypothetical protein
MDTQLPHEDQGRDALGRFLKGNLFGKGNPFARHSAALRQAFCDEATLDAAKGGDWVAA